MSKMKTQKSIAKRFSLTKTGKMIKRKAGQDHFNAKESGNITRNKRRDVRVDPTLAQNLRKRIVK